MRLAALHGECAVLNLGEAHSSTLDSSSTPQPRAITASLDMAWEPPGGHLGLELQSPGIMEVQPSPSWEPSAHVPLYPTELQSSVSVPNSIMKSTLCSWGAQDSTLIGSGVNTHPQTPITRFVPRVSQFWDAHLPRYPL